MEAGSRAVEHSGDCEYSSSNEHKECVAYRTFTSIKKKYSAGQAEHGGRLWKKPVLRMLGDEVTDMNVYYDVLREQLERVSWILRAGMSKADAVDPAACCISAYNILTYGNEEGIVEPDE